MQTPSLLFSLESFQKHDVFPQHAVHPFATPAPATSSLLQELINTTEQLSRSLDIYDSSVQWSNAKLTSLLRQHTSIEHASHSSAKNAQHLIDALSARTGIHYGENIPLLSDALSQWCIEQLAAWGVSVGMETFPDDSREGGSTTVVLGGKVLVIDVDFVIERDDPFKPRIKVANVKTSNALLPGSTNPSTSTMMDAFLKDSIEKYCIEMQKSQELRNPLKAATLRKDVLNNLQYLVLLDGLASRKEDGGIRWFTDIDEICPTLIGVAKTEAEAIASSLLSSKAPLDIFLLRSHSLPLPYLTMPSISFLVYLSPSSYLSLLRNSSNNEQTEDDLPLDIGPSKLRTQMGKLAKGVTVATLFLDKLSEAHLYPPSMSMPDVPARPTFTLAPSMAELDHSFPLLDGFGVDVIAQESNSGSGPYAWVLDFTDGGKRPGVVMSQSRMKAIELVVNPLGGGDDLPVVTDMLSFGTGSWIDLLVDPGNMVSPERYTALYRSSNALHPPLQLRLTAPEEPGFTLERVPVHSIKEIWGILEVVREQCWLNEILLSCHWTTEGLKTEEEDVVDDTTATEEDLQAILAGNFIPRKIPVNVSLPSGSATDSLFGPGLDFASTSGPRIVMTCPERPPIAGLVEITVARDETKPKGVSVEISGAMGVDLKPADLEEICRRGGTLGLSGRVWASGHGMTS